MNRCAAKALVLIGGILAGCQAKESQRPADPRAVSACMATQNSNDDYFLVTTCDAAWATRKGPRDVVRGV
jgi:hypothetical protein